MDMETRIELPGRRNRNNGLRSFANELQLLTNKVGMKLSARGWGYQLEGFRLITKDQFDFVENLINECRKKGYLPVNFTAEEEARQFSGVEIPDTMTIPEHIKLYLQATLNSGDYYTPDWWEGEKYYIQMVVEKIDIKNLFEPVCREYHIPIATSKGWSSIIQRATYARRFKYAEQNGLICVLLYCGDHDPDGLRISEFLRNNLRDIAGIHWEDGVNGYNPENLIIDRFGLNYDFIQENSLTWIENLITGSGKNLADPGHKNYHMDYVQSYLEQIGEKKCEANALIVRKEEGRQLCRDTIEKYIGKDALDRFKRKRQVIKGQVEQFLNEIGLGENLRNVIRQIEGDDD